MGLNIFIDTEIGGKQLVGRYAAECLADAGYVPAIATVGRMHLKGLAGYAVDAARAFQTFEDGARRGDPLAMYWLGHCLEQGIGCRPDAACALAWYERAPESPNVELKVARARLYRRGLGDEAHRADLPDLHHFILSFFEQCLGPHRSVPLVMRPSAAEAVEAYVRAFGRRT